MLLQSYFQHIVVLFMAVSCGTCQAHLSMTYVQYIPRNMHTVFALLCFVVVIHWLIFPYPSGLLHWHCGNLTIAPVPAKQPWWIWINTSCEFIMNDCITTTKQSTTKPCAYFLGYTVLHGIKLYGGYFTCHSPHTDFYSRVWPSQNIYETISSRDPRHYFKIWCSVIMKSLNYCLSMHICVTHPLV